MGRVVVVDDEPAVLEVVCLVLNAAGHEAVGVGHPNVLFDLEMSPRPDIFLIDVMLPALDGITLADRLRRGQFAHTPMIAISASNQWLHRADESGLFDSLLRKPFDVDALLTEVERTSEKHREVWEPTPIVPYPHV